ncbi:hypothetical protein FKR81_40890 [Lentzea tibetensis]|uniref:Uncharacterized protein n=1 Tax=Lentzea tibetensis TaxID=2591470 RepID=A0A563EFJ0_9PSEU|nr:hypothetical protein [Lentzea tibetensis]TWP44737.1 hypothetical protein FKR81_40890 [Lentzea tibetensis]
MTRAELLRLYLCAVRRPRPQLVLAAILSIWTLAWVIGQLTPHQPTPLGLVAWTGLPLHAASEWARERADVLIWLATVGGLSWAATTERAQLPALSGWFAVLVAGEAAGYQHAVHRALLSMVAFMAVLAVVSITGRRAFVVDRVAVIPRDVLRACVTAAVLSAIVPLIAPGLALTRLVSPYVTKPPKPDPTRLRRVEPMGLREAR